jgi:hypothetical protein
MKFKKKTRRKSFKKGGSGRKNNRHNRVTRNKVEGSPSGTVCNPNSRKKKVGPNTCFTPKAVDLLRNLYNMKYPDQRVRASTPREILAEIQVNSKSECKKDICLINEFAKTPRDKNVLKALLFPPPQPKEWNDDPDAWLSNFDIIDVLRQYEASYPHFTFIGPSPIDYNTKLSGIRCVCPRLCRFNLENWLNHIEPERGVAVTKIGIIFNLDPHHKGGSHWVSMFVDLVDNFIFYFNSTSAPIPARINNLVLDIQKQGLNLKPPKKLSFHQNTLTSHQKWNSECGMYSLYFIITMLLREKEINYNSNTTPETQKMSAHELIDMFKGRNGYPRITDKDMFNKRKEYYSKNET